MLNLSSLQSSFRVFAALGVFILVGNQLTLSFLAVFSSESALDSSSSLEIIEETQGSPRQLHLLPQWGNPGKGKKERDEVIAYMISVTSCFSRVPNEPAAVDGAAVLAQSIRQVNVNSSYGFALFAMVHPNATICAQELEAVGYHVFVRDIPFDVEQVQSDFWKATVEYDGCCGAKEFLKLFAYNFTQYPLVVHLDVDSLLLQPLDELFDFMLQPNNGYTSLPTMPRDIQHSQQQQPLHSSSQTTILFTREYHSLKSYRDDRRKIGLQGAFFVLRPNATRLEELINRILTTPYRDRSWPNGYGGYWGDTTIQGFLSYIYGEFYPHEAVELDPCRYNTLMWDDRYYEDTTVCKTLETVCEDCSQTPWHQVRLAHLSLCTKPWKCSTARRRRWFRDSLCQRAHRVWWKLRQALELKLNLTQPEPGSGYHYYDVLGYCMENQTYIPLNLTEYGIEPSARKSPAGRSK